MMFLSILLFMNSPSLIINLTLGLYQEIHPYRPISIGFVKINPSTIMMREWIIIKFPQKVENQHHSWPPTIKWPKPSRYTSPPVFQTRFYIQLLKNKCSKKKIFTLTLTGSLGHDHWESGIPRQLRRLVRLRWSRIPGKVETLHHSGAPAINWPNTSQLWMTSPTGMCRGEFAFVLNIPYTI